MSPEQGGDVTEEGLREELRLVEEEIAQLSAAGAELRRRVTEGVDEPVDPEERAASLTAAEEQEAIVATLEQRRRELQQRIAALTTQQ
jgi:hypothetical protein